MIHACRSVVRLHSRKGSPQVGQRVDLVHQTVPLASHHSLFESRQHPFRPDLGFDPGPSRPNLSGGLSRTCRHCFRDLPCSVRHVSTFLRPFAPDPLQALPRSYGRSDSCSPGSAVPGSCRRPPLRLLHEQVSLIHAPDLPTLPSPTTCGRSVSPGHVTPRQIEPRSLLHGTSPNGNSGLRHCTAGSPSDTGRIEFLIVRTGRSPPAAPHPVSRRRSCLQLLVYVEPERTFTSLAECATSGAQCGGSSHRLPPEVHTGAAKDSDLDVLSIMITIYINNIITIKTY